MVLQLGIPTWFCSFSAADRRWPEIREAILLQQKKDIPQEMSWEDHCQTIKSNPVTATIMFQRRVHAFINKVILSKSNPIGHVIDYFYRVEFQSRGWPHIHCLFWIKDAPVYDRNCESNVAIEKFIHKFINCNIPDDVVDIVQEVQTHSRNHSKSCKKNNKTCRFNFPRPPSLRTFL